MPFPHGILFGISWSYSHVLLYFVTIGYYLTVSPSATDITHYPAGTCRRIDVNMMSLHPIDVDTTFLCCSVSAGQGQPVFKPMMLTSESFVNLLKIVFHTKSYVLIQSNQISKS